MVDLFAVVVGIARSQKGIVTRPQLLEAGISPARIRTWLERGHLVTVHRGVYAIGPPSLIPLARESAALLAVGASSALGYRSAAAAWGMAEPDGAVDVVVAGRWPKARHGIRLHRVKELNPRDVTTKEGLRLTAPARTVIDFATDASGSELQHALAEARAQRLITDASLEAALARLPRADCGAAKVRALLRRYVGQVMTRSERERKVLNLLAAAGLPKPLVNVRLHGYEADFYWPDRKLVLEFDGFQFHGTRPAFESDRKRDQTFAAAGIQTVRATWLQLEHEPVALVVRIGQALAARQG